MEYRVVYCDNSGNILIRNATNWQTCCALAEQLSKRRKITVASKALGPNGVEIKSKYFAPWARLIASQVI